jgi:hypothetical protein
MRLENLTNNSLSYKLVNTTTLNLKNRHLTDLSLFFFSTPIGVEKKIASAAIYLRLKKK